MIHKLLNRESLVRSYNYVTRFDSYYKSSLNHESFMNGTSSSYLEDMYRLWKEDHRQVHISWDTYFRGLESQRSIGNAYVTPPNMSVAITKSGTNVQSKPFNESCPMANESTIKEYLEIQSVIQSFRLRGHMVATLDPLGITRGENLKAEKLQKHVLRHYKIPKDLNKKYFLHNTDYIGGGEYMLPLREILKRLEISYCGNIGVEYMYIEAQDKLNFIREKIETPGARSLSNDEKKVILKRIIRAYNFEDFLGKKFPTEKRFGLEGGEVLIPAVKAMIDKASANGVDIFNIGIAHRGRLNILANVVNKPLSDIFAQFNPIQLSEGDGDVKYHLGTYLEHINSQTKRPVIVSVTANPSHLEAVNPIVLGKTYGERMMIGDKDGDKVWSILIHGDAATTGQGVVYETFHLSELPCFTNHGSIHIVINNQIGFTTDPRVARSSEYCTAIAKVSSAPVFHVNGDDPESVCYVMKVAAEFKLKFKTDVVIDIVCYRKHGHSEADQPKFTQPLMYTVIGKTTPVSQKYTEYLINEGTVNSNDVENIENESKYWLQKGFESSLNIKEVHKRDWLDSPWKNFFTKDKDLLYVPDTGANKEVLLEIANAVSVIPPNFEIHPGLARTLKARQEMIEKNYVDWAIGEALAFGTLKHEGFNVRLTGQDVERGTFSQRHHVYHHQSEDQVTYKPLHNIFPDRGDYTVCNSSLSEFGVLGFEVGYSMISPYNLVMWEAQFGDFSNSAQVVIDTFIAAGEAKWGRQTGIVMLLPHGLEGQGPEHSSARPERYLQLCAEPSEPQYLDNMPEQLLRANWFVANVTTPANLFHILRRQVKLNFRKPLIIFTPKSILRHPEAKSPFEDMMDGTKFKPYLKDESLSSVDDVEKVLFCTGKVYYELKAEREKKGLDNKVALCRIEQLFPFPYGDVIHDSMKYSKARFFWAQEEHRNQGWWQFVQPRIEFCVEREVEYLGRIPAASPSTGNKLTYVKEHRAFMDQCFN